MKVKMCISILIVMILFASLNISNFKSIATTTANIVIDTKNVVQGNEVEVNIKLQNNVDFSAANFILTYDSNILEYKRYTVGDTLKKTDGSINGTVLINESINGEIKIGYMSDATQASETKKVGTMLKLVFLVKSGAGNTSELEFEATTLKKDDGTNVSANITNGKLRIISGIKMNKSSLNLKVGNTSTLTLSTLPTAVDISNETTTWSSSNTSVATVNSNGMVTAVSAGTAKITATVLGLNAECAITVENVSIPLQSISLSETEVTLNVGENKTLEVTYNPANTTDAKNVMWSSGNENIATVDSYGKITAVSAGTTEIIATVGTKTAKCTVLVKKPLSISLDITNLTLPCQQIKQLTVSYNQENVSKNVTWTTSDDSIVTVNQNGLITALKEGTATITATVNDISATCTVTVSGRLGDLDQDDNITAYDAYKTLEISVDISLDTDVDSIDFLTSDVNRDQNVTAQDAYNILEYSVGLIDEF